MRDFAAHTTAFLKCELLDSTLEKGASGKRSSLEN